MSDQGGSRLDRIARELASGEISRRSALKRLAGIGAGLGAATAPAIAEAMGGGCPGDRVKCDGKCCPKNARCRDGKCKCKRGFKKCGRKCVDTSTSFRHCGACNSPCADGETCINSICSECATATECPQPAVGSCQKATCVNGTCGTESDNNNLPNDLNQCTADTCSDGTPIHSNLGPGTACDQNGGTVCDGSGQCVQCLTPTDCPGDDTACSTRTCEDGVCGTTINTGEICGETQAGCPEGSSRPVCCRDTGACSQTCGTCQPF